MNILSKSLNLSQLISKTVDLRHQGSVFMFQLVDQRLELVAACLRKKYDQEMGSE